MKYILFSIILFVPMQLMAEQNILLNKTATIYDAQGTQSGESIVDGNDFTGIYSTTNPRMSIAAEIDLNGVYTINKLVVHSGADSKNGFYQAIVRYNDGYCWITPPGGESQINVSDTTKNEFTVTLVQPIDAKSIQVLVRSESTQPWINEVEGYGTYKAENLSGSGHCPQGQTVVERSPYYDAAVHYPPNYNIWKKKKYPLILSMTGLGGSILSPKDHKVILKTPEGFTRQFVSTSSQSQLANYGAIVVNLECRRYTLIQGDCRYDPNLVLKQMAQFQRSHHVDSDVIWLTGLSGGGSVVFDMASNYADKLAGVVGVSTGNGNSNCTQDNLHIWHTTGEVDTIFPPSLIAKQKESVDKCSPSDRKSEYKITIIPGAGHNGDAWNAVYGNPEVRNFMIVNKRIPSSPAN